MVEAARWQRICSRLSYLFISLSLEHPQAWYHRFIFTLLPLALVVPQYSRANSCTYCCVCVCVFHAGNRTMSALCVQPLASTSLHLPQNDKGRIYNVHRSCRPMLRLASTVVTRSAIPPSLYDTRNVLCWPVVTFRPKSVYASCCCVVRRAMA